MNNVYYTLFYGLGMSLTLSLIIMGTLVLNPRLLIHRYPPEIAGRELPKTAIERKYTKLLAFPFLSILLVLPVLSVAFLKFVNEGSIDYWSATLHIFSLLTLFNLIDLFILDWLIFCFITPKFLILPGTEGMKAYKNYRFHLRGFLIGIVLSVAASALCALIIFIL